MIQGSMYTNIYIYSMQSREDDRVKLSSNNDIYTFNSVELNVFAWRHTSSSISSMFIICVCVFLYMFIKMQQNDKST